jgi:hypothetical protein
MRFGVAQSGCSAGDGSWVNISNAAPGDIFVVQGLSEIVLRHDRPTTDVDEPGGRLHPFESSGVEHAPGLLGERGRDDDVVGVRQQR